MNRRNVGEGGSNGGQDGSGNGELHGESGRGNKGQL